MPHGNLLRDESVHRMADQDGAFKMRGLRGRSPGVIGDAKTVEGAVRVAFCMSGRVMALQP